MSAAFGPWIVERPIGRGGVATVYRCHHTTRTEVVAALKVLHRTEGAPLVVPRLAREVRVLRRLDHPAIVRALDGDPNAPEPWIALELVDGQPLDRARPGRRPPDEVADLAITLTDALVHAHRLGVWHRDVKPANILIERATGSVRLVDFGIAAADNELSLTEPGGLGPGTIDYSPPEWFTGQSRTNPAAIDAYALGVVLYEQLVGEPAFPVRGEGKLSEALRRKVATQQLDPGPDVPEPLRSVVRALTQARLPERASLEEVLPRLLAARGMPAPSARLALEQNDAFVGRDELLAALEALDGQPLVTLIGAAGVGKSRLARHHLATTGAVVAVDLSTVRAADGLDRAMALALGVSLSDVDPASQVERALAGSGPVRVLLDDAEGVVEALRQRVPRWMRAAPQATLWITSRQKLRLPEERVLVVPPLDRSAAVELLGRRAKEHGRPGFERGLAERLVEAADRLPLCVELVATRADAPSERELAGWLAGQGALEGALASSFDRLPAEGRRVLAASTVFRGGFGLQMAEQVLGTRPDEPPLFEVLQLLVDTGLLAVRRGLGAFHLLRTVRAFAERRLSPGEARALRDAHATAFSRRCEELGRRGELPGEAELPDLDAALEHARSGLPALVGPLTRALGEISRGTGLPAPDRTAVVERR
ncbi:MAG: protein kinase [Alphaproteobacteria bacterium]|nr:protein kinase [Alphaproteobacteria bacterium]